MPNKHKIGEILEKDGYITQEQLNKVLECQQTLKDHKLFGKICIDMGFLTKEKLHLFLQKWKTHIQIGDMLVNKILVTEKQIKEIKKKKEKKDQRL